MRVAADPMKMEELLDLPVSFGVREAVRALGLGEGKAYEYARAGEIPGKEGCYEAVRVRKYGQEYRVTRPDLFIALGLPPGLIRDPKPETS